uniref:Uncharacterized protein n=1 Tax=Anguilla anguilla TaxID=7936 RepID=A0A0E9WQD0_ANGAN
MFAMFFIYFYFIFLQFLNCTVAYRTMCIRRLDYFSFLTTIFIAIAKQKKTCRFYASPFEY